MQKLSLRFVVAFIICAAGSVLFGYVASIIRNKSIENFDTSIIAFVQGMESPWLTPIMQAFTWIGSGYVVATVTVIGFILLFFVYRYRQQAFLLVTVIAGTVLLNGLLKVYFKRERPEIHRIMDAPGFSFPSGHTMMAFSLYTILAYIAWRNVKTATGRTLLVLSAGLMITLIAGSRIYLGVHYPSDIVGGIAASAFWVTIVISVYGLYQQQKTTSRQ
ncbi:phosphatase PAP2 family protein [Sporosarcina sp. G11-34]|uniref:phosphatase PAP2 family protein n=1 Tax=Sporosarcina sp. G11-34 TaxID=2849605 RepID=UPI0022A8DAB6|nr:phosphatase PAP2 family protein [Sporosarcina sp. G11-34]MCZ2259121.1 phosphatase PAP2 family protein [Sporosarcina sp. G11-34]